MLFKITAAILVAVFIYYGMDVRRKAGARDFIAPVWQVLMKLCSFSLIGAFVWVVYSAHQLSLVDWAGMAAMASGTAFVVAAKRALGGAHTFTGQYLEEPRLVTYRIYAITRNPLYFGVFQCGIGALLVIGSQVPALLPQSHPYWLTAFAVALVYAVSFNWSMAVREARYLESCFGEDYRRYRARVPFFIPVIRLSKEIE